MPLARRLKATFHDNMPVPAHNAFVITANRLARLNELVRPGTMYICQMVLELGCIILSGASMARAAEALPSADDFASP